MNLSLSIDSPIVCHAFNKDRTELALSSNSHEVLILKKNEENGSWQEYFRLSEHDKLVTGIDWDPVHNRIVTCSQDRNAYVWTPVMNHDNKTEAWKPTLVILRINRAATQVKWSPNGKKFAVASGARCISICYFEKDNDWWVSRHIKKPIRSTILCVDWHPNNILLAAGSTDFKARVFSAYIKKLDDDSTPPSSWGPNYSFGEMFCEYSAGGWVHDIGFSPDGEYIAFVSHDSTLSVSSAPQAPLPLDVSLKTASLPFTSLLWITAKSIIAAGHDANPTLFSLDGSILKLIERLDLGKAKDPNAGQKDQSALKMFKQIDSRGQESDEDNQGLKTFHQNAISGLSPYNGKRGEITKFSSVGMDGKLIIWDLDSLRKTIPGLKII